MHGETHWTEFLWFYAVQSTAVRNLVFVWWHNAEIVAVFFFENLIPTPHYCTHILTELESLLDDMRTRTSTVCVVLKSMRNHVLAIRYFLRKTATTGFPTIFFACFFRAVVYGLVNSFMQFVVMKLTLNVCLATNEWALFITVQNKSAFFQTMCFMSQ